MRRLSDVDLHLLRIFKAIADSGSLLGAQLALNLSQSTISTQLAELEKKLGFRLCQRGRAGFALTSGGRTVYEACADLFTAVDRFQNVAASISGQMNGVLRVSIVDAILSNPHFDIASVLRDFADRASSVLIELAVASPAQMERDIYEGAKDVAIGPFFRQTAGIVYVPAFRERQALYCAKHHPQYARKRDRVEDLRATAFVARSYLHRYDLERVGLVRASAVVEHMEAQAALILSGHFIGYLPVHYAAFLSRSRPLRRISTPELEYDFPFYLIHKKGAEDSVVVRRFINRIKEVLAGAEPEQAAEWAAIPLPVP